MGNKQMFLCIPYQADRYIIIITRYLEHHFFHPTCLTLEWKEKYINMEKDVQCFAQCGGILENAA
jgi:hypothetical protein